MGKLCLSFACLISIYFYGQRFEEYIFLPGIPSPRNSGLLQFCFPQFSTDLETIYIVNKYNKPCKAQGMPAYLLFSIFLDLA